jgi:hypothetical protein
VAKTVRIWLQMTYRCCGMEWTDEWPTPLKIECPDCGELIEAHEVIEIGPRPAARKPAALLTPSVSDVLTPYQRRA